MDKQKKELLKNVIPIKQSKSEEVFKCWAILSNVKGVQPVGCWQGTIHTQELTKEQKDRFTDFNNVLGVFVFAETDVKMDDLKDIPELKGEFEKEKSPSLRLRNVLWVYFKQTHRWIDDAEHRKEFNTWRETQMEKFIQTVKNKLD